MGGPSARCWDAEVRLTGVVPIPGVAGGGRWGRVRREDFTEEGTFGLDL